MSPADKGHGDIVGDGETTVASASGDAVIFNSRAQFAGAVGSGVSGQTQYIARRGSGAWNTLAITPMPRADALQTFFASTKLQLFSKDLNTAVLWGYDLPQSTGSAPERNQMYVEDTATRGLRPISTSQADPLGLFDFIGEQVWGASDDARHIAFVTNTRLLPDAVPGGPNLYQWDDDGRGGTLSLAGVLPNDTLDPGGATVVPDNYREAMSADGSRLAFRSPAFDPAGQLYLRIGGRRTVWVSQPEGTDQSTPTNVLLQGMTRDGKNVFFVTDAPLLDSDTNGGPDLYRWTDSANPAADSNLTMISQDGDASGNLSGGALVGFSEDGQRAYYHTQTDKLVVWDHGSRHQIATMQRNAEPRFQLTATVSKPGYGRVTPDADYLAFLTSQTTDNVHGLTGEVTNGHVEMYVYSLRDDTLNCVSCPPGDATDNATVTPTVTAGNPTLDDIAIRPHYLSDDGNVFFSTNEALLPEDANGVADTYEYDAATGELSLISTGKGRDPAMFADASPSGDDVFVLTRQRLDSTDRDDAVDLYDVRVGAAPPKPEVHEQPPCDGETCQPPPSSAPDDGALGSLTFEDNASGSLAPKKGLVAKQSATVHGASGSLSVRLLVPGTLKWSGRGLSSGSAKRGRAGTVRVSLQLNRRARTQLRRNGRYQTTLRLTLAQVGGVKVTATTRVTFRATAKKGR